MKIIYEADDIYSSSWKSIVVQLNPCKRTIFHARSGAIFNGHSNTLVELPYQIFIIRYQQLDYPIRSFVPHPYNISSHLFINSLNVLFLLHPKPNLNDLLYHSFLDEKPVSGAACLPHQYDHLQYSSEADMVKNIVSIYYGSEHNIGNIQRSINILMNIKNTVYSASRKRIHYNNVVVQKLSNGDHIYTQSIKDSVQSTMRSNGFKCELSPFETPCFNLKPCDINLP